MDQDRLKDLWEDDSIVESVKDKVSEESREENGEIETSGSQSDDSGNTIVPNKSMETNNNQYEPTTTDLE